MERCDFQLSRRTSLPSLTNSCRMPDQPDNLTFPITLRHEHRLVFTRDVFGEHNPVLADVLTPREPGEGVRAMVFWDAGLETAFPGIGGKIAHWFSVRVDRLRLAAAPVAVPGGEWVKNDFTQLEKVWAAMNAAGLCRHSYVIGWGGAVSQVVAAGTAHRHPARAVADDQPQPGRRRWG